MLGSKVRVVSYSLRSDPQAWLEQASGSYALIGHTDAAFGLEQESSDSGIYIFAGKRRNGPAPTLVLESKEDTLRFEIASDDKLLAGC